MNDYYNWGTLRLIIHVRADEGLTNEQAANRAFEAVRRINLALLELEMPDGVKVELK